MLIADLVRRPLKARVHLRESVYELVPITGAQSGQIRAAYPRPDAPMTTVNGNVVANEGNGFYQTTLDSWMAKCRAAEFAIAAGVKLADGTGYDDAQAKVKWIQEASVAISEALTETEVAAALGAIKEQIAASVRGKDVRGNLSPEAVAV